METQTCSRRAYTLLGGRRSQYKPIALPHTELKSLPPPRCLQDQVEAKFLAFKALKTGLFRVQTQFTFADPLLLPQPLTPPYALVTRGREPFAASTSLHPLPCAMTLPGFLCSVPSAFLPRLLSVLVKTFLKNQTFCFEISVPLRKSCENSAETRH